MQKRNLPLLFIVSSGLAWPQASTPVIAVPKLPSVAKKSAPKRAPGQKQASELPREVKPRHWPERCRDVAEKMLDAALSAADALT